MSERILNILMQLFAIIAKINDHGENGSSDVRHAHQIIRSFLKIELASEKIEHYIVLFDQYYAALHPRRKSKYSEGKRNSVNSVKVLRICNEINKELTIRQKFIVLMRIMELILLDENCSELELAFLRTVADTFKIEPEEYLRIFSLLKNEISTDQPPENCFIITGKNTTEDRKFKLNGLDHPIVCIRVHNNNLLFFKYFGNDDIYLNGELLDNRKAFLLNPGDSINTSKSDRIYQADLLNRFLSTSTTRHFLFKATDLSYRFPFGAVGLHPFSTTIHSGQLVGIMGGSGTGKSTLVDLLSGAKRPQTGTVTINGIDVHRSPKEIEGLIGYVPQEDLLIEELTVFENLYYSARLVFGKLSENEIRRKVIQVLDDLNLSSVKHLKVGSPLKKVISGGQRKRLNIALELIRNPSILFVDEPTSGLSSIGSLKIMNILKNLSLKGTLVFVVIHQPSSDVFKLLNRLILLDYGGYQIFDGVPSTALPHFKKALEYANADSEGCSVCGNVNPDQIFEIVEAQTVNEFGVPTRERKHTPKQWHELFLKQKQEEETNSTEELKTSKKELPSPLKLPGLIQQFSVFFARDFKSKISSFQYVLLILAEAPVLALILSSFLKSYIETEGAPSYLYYYNENIPVYLFVSMLVSIFLGMTVAAEEINKDKKNLKRERFLNLNWGSYLYGKMALLLLISAIQSFLFVLVGNVVLQITELWFENWLMLFSVSFWSNLLGLNVSLLFRQTKLIYIAIPILIIPQIIFSGLIVRYDRMNPVFSHPHKVPWIGNLMISRWAYEGLTVEFASENSFAAITFDLQQKGSELQWKKDYWIPKIRELVEHKKNGTLIKNELSKEEEKWDNLTCVNCFQGGIPEAKNIDRFLSVLHLQYTNNYNTTIDSIEVVKKRFGLKRYAAYREKYDNEGLERLVTGRDRIAKIYVDHTDNRIYQLEDPLYQSSDGLGFFNAPYFIKEKSIGSYRMDTFYANLLIIWLFSLILYHWLHSQETKKRIRLYIYETLMEFQLRRKRSSRRKRLQ